MAKDGHHSFMFRWPVVFREFLVIDPGSSFSVLAMGDAPRIFREPSLVALSLPRRGKTRLGKLLQSGVARVLGAGTETSEIPDLENEAVQWVYPVSQGRLEDPYALELVLQRLVDQEAAGWMRGVLTRKRVGLMIAPQLPSEERLKFQEVLRGFGLGRLAWIDAPSAAVVGSGMDISEPRGRMLIDVGGGKTTLTAFSMGSATLSQGVPFGGNQLDEAVVQFVLKRFRLRIGLKKARYIKEALGAVYPKPQPQSLKITGSDAPSGIEKKVTLDDNELRDVLMDGCEPLLLGIQQAFEGISPELSSDIAQSEILLTGGGAVLSGLAEFLSERTGLRFRTPTDPINAAVRGGMALLREGRVEDA